MKKKKQKYVFSDKEIKIKDLHHVYNVKEILSLGAKSIHLRNNGVFFFCRIKLFEILFILRHVAEFTVLKPNTRLMCQMYHEKSPAKIL